MHSPACLRSKGQEGARTAALFLSLVELAKISWVLAKRPCSQSVWDLNPEKKDDGE